MPDSVLTRNSSTLQLQNSCFLHLNFIACVSTSFDRNLAKQGHKSLHLNTHAHYQLNSKRIASLKTNSVPGNMVLFNSNQNERHDIVSKGACWRDHNFCQYCQIPAFDTTSSPFNSVSFDHFGYPTSTLQWNLPSSSIHGRFTWCAPLKRKKQLSGPH